MSFFGRTFIVLALFAGAVHVFRRDITRVVGVLKKPTENFIKEVKNELETGSKTTSNLLNNSGVNNATKETVIDTAAKQAANSVHHQSSSSPSSSSIPSTGKTGTNPPELK